MKNHTAGRWVAVAVAIVVLAPTAAAEVRTWSDAASKFKVEAELLSATGGKVRLRRADGKEITVPLARLSEADRAFIKDQPPGDAATERPSDAVKKPVKKDRSASQSAPDANSAGKDIREIAERFYADLRPEQRAAATAALTDAAQKLVADKKSPLTALPMPDEHARAIKPGKAKLDGTQAEIPVQVRFGGQYQKTLLHLRNDGDGWRVFAISATLGGQEQTTSFETPIPSADKPADPLLALVGQKMDLAGYTVDGKPLDMSNYRGKVALVDFWATWCGPCRAEIPNIFANWQKYHDSGFEVIAISVDSELGELQKFLAEEQPPWTVVVDRHPLNRNSMGGKYGISGIPAFILIGKDGKVAAVHCRGDRLGQALAKLLPGSNATASK